MISVQSANELDAFYSTADPWGYHDNVDDERRRMELLAALPQRSFKRTLDIGCGNGYVTLTLPGDEVVGVDLSSEAVRWAREAARPAPRSASRFRFEKASLFDPHLASHGQFDLVVVTGVLYPQYIGKARSLARLQIDRVLAPGGIVATCHIREWEPLRLGYTLLDATLYPYRAYTHQLEVYLK